MKLKIFKIICFLVFIPIIANANLSSVNNVHDEILSQKNITVPVESGVDINGVSSVHYLFEQIDKANEILNGEPTTSYGTSVDAISNPVTISKVATDVDELIQLNGIKINLVNASWPAIAISAPGNYIIDWGDGTVDTIAKTDTAQVYYNHSYSVTGDHSISLKGKATGYNSSTTVPAISFQPVNTSLSSIAGSLGKIFPVVDGVAPSFSGAFQNCTVITSLPSGLFSGINAVNLPDYMFSSTFNGCTALTSLPDGLFSGITGTTSSYMFYQTFSGCTNLASLGNNLFGNISGAPKPYIFELAFYGCKFTTLPSGLFSGIVGAPAAHMFFNTFGGNTYLTTVPSGLFSGISGAPAPYMFQSTFYNCTSLTSIPDAMFAGISGAPAEYMFTATFSGCTSLVGALPSGLFGSISGVPAQWMFANTFYGCNQITDISQVFVNCEFVQGSATRDLYYTFYNCTAATSASPADKNGLKFYNWDNSTSNLITFRNDVNLSDYADIPAIRK